MSKPNYRQMFGDMPELKHDQDHEKSDVLRYIRWQLECDLAESVRVFNMLRNPRRRILSYNTLTKRWSGESNINVPAELRRLAAKCAALEVRLQQVEGAI